MSLRVRACACAVACGFVPAAVGAQERTPSELLDAIVRSGPLAVAIRSVGEVTRREQLARLAYPNPSVIYSREGAGFTEFLQMEQGLPLFGVRAALVRAGVAAVAAAEAERDARLWTLHTDASSLIARVIAEQERASAAQSAVRDIERLVGMLQTREHEGEGSHFDRMRAEQELADARQVEVSASVAVAASRSSLVALLPRHTQFTRVIGALYAFRDVPALEALLSRAANTRAELKALRLSAERASLEADAARRAHLPTPSVSGGVKRADDAAGREAGGVIGISLALPLFDTGSREAARWNAERARLEAERAAVEQSIRTRISAESEALALRRQALSRTGAADAQELVGIAELAYREGDVRILELLDALRTASRARMRDIDMRLETRLAEIALESAVGDELWP